MDAHRFGARLDRVDGFKYRVEFDDPALGTLEMDEAPPLGEGSGPNAARLLAAAVANCLSASLQMCLSRAHLGPEQMSARVEGTLVRNGRGRLRVGELRVVIEPTVPESARARFSRCMDVFEDYCLVTESVRNGIDVLVEVRPTYSGETLASPETEAAAPAPAAEEPSEALVVAPAA